MNIHKKIIIVVHEMAYGPPQALRDYLNRNKTDDVSFLGLPFYTQKNVIYSEYHKGKLIYNSSKYCIFSTGICAYLRDFILIFTKIIIQKKTYDTFIGADALICFAGLCLKTLGKIKRVLFYTMDFSPIRFRNRFLNSIYHSIEIFCVKYSDATWNVSPRMADGREKFFKLSKILYPQHFIPVGIWRKEIPKIPYDHKRRYNLLFIGHIIKKQGVQMVIKALPNVVRKHPNINLLIIGDGEYLETLRGLVKGLHMDHFVTMTGWINDRKNIYDKMVNCGIALATYEPELAQLYNFSYYGDPGKLKNYLAAGLPVILTDISYNAKIIQKKHCGLLVNYDERDIARAILSLIENEILYKDLRTHALQYAKQLEWSSIFDDNIKYL